MNKSKLFLFAVLLLATSMILSCGKKKNNENIYPDAKCYKEGMDLYREIKDKVLDDWKFVMKIYQDGVDIEKERIKAWRDVGVAYGNHQQPISNYVNWLLR